MSVTWEYIYEAVTARRSRDTTILKRMVAVRDRVNCDIITPLPDVKGEPDVEAPMPSLVSDAIEHNAMRAGSTRPRQWHPAIAESDLARKRAHTRKRAAMATRVHSNGQNLARRAFRHLYGYGTCSLIVTPDFTWENRFGPPELRPDRRYGPGVGRARWELRDPLTTYPEHRSPDDMRPPLNCAYVYGKSPEWIRRTWGHIAGVREMLGNNPAWCELWDVVEWIDDQWCVIGILGPRLSEQWDEIRTSAVTTRMNREILRYPNRCGGMVPVAAPWRVTLDRQAGAVGHLLNITDWIARLTALEVTSAEKGVFPDLVAIGADPAVEPMIVGGKWKPGRTGDVNLLHGVSAVNQLHNQPNLLTRQLIDALEGNFSSSAGLLPQFQGQTSGALRTGRGIQTLTEIASDPRTMELQEIWCNVEATMVEASFELEKEMWPRRKFVVFTGIGSDKGTTTYVPGNDFDTTQVGVEYPFPGVDIAQLSVMLPQRVGAGLMSKRTAMESDPFVSDAEDELQRLRSERLEDAVLAALLQHVVDPSSPMNPIDLLKVAAHMRDTDADLVDAFLEIQRRAQEAQAAAPPEQPTPEQMPGVLQPGLSEAPAQAPAAPGPPGDPRQQFAALMSAAMASPRGATPQDQAVIGGARPPAVLTPGLRPPQSAPAPAGAR
jgi:hypothetical protein